MKRTGFAPRKSPMKRSRKPSPQAIRIEPDAFRAVVKVKKMGSRKKAATKAEREHMDRVARMGCVVCRNLGYGPTPCEIHHPRFLAGGGQRASHMDAMGLCPQHHRLGAHGVAYHAGPEEFERRYGTEAQLLEQTRRELGIEVNQPMEQET